jgi:hypothetical protein
VLIHGSISGSISAAGALANLVANSNDNKVSVCNIEGVLPRLVELALGGPETDRPNETERLSDHIGEKDRDKDPDKLSDISNSGKGDEQACASTDPNGQRDESNGENGCERDEPDDDDENGTSSIDHSQSNGHNDDLNASTDNDKNRTQASPHSGGHGSEPSTPTARPGGRGLRCKGQEAAARAMLNLASNKEASNMLVATPNAVTALCQLMLHGSK